MPKILPSVILFCMSAGVVSAHEHWIVVEHSGARATVRICSGHDFPRSDTLLAQHLLTDTVVVDPAGVAIPFAPEAQARNWEAGLVFDRPGVWAVAFALAKPQSNDRFYAGRCLTIVGGLDNPARYATGKGLELVPGAPLATLHPGGSLPVMIHQDGSAVDGKIVVTRANGSVAFLSAGLDRPADVPIPTAGTYRLAVSQKGKTFALTFSVAEYSETTP